VRSRPQIPSRDSRPFDVVGFGLNSVDLLTVVPAFPEPDSKQQLKRFARMPGGQAATAMVTCARLGWRARYVGRFGADEHGTLGRQSLDDAGVDTTLAATVPGSFNQFAVILVDERTGQRTVMWDRDPALRMKPEDVPAEGIASGRILLVDCHETLAAREAARIAHHRAMPTVIDVEKVRPRIEDLLKEIDVIIASQVLPTELTGYGQMGQALEHMEREFPAWIVCVTLGPEGSLARVGGREVRTRGFRTPAVDTTGAGDVFRGGFVSGWLTAGDSGSVEDILTFANAVAALKCRALGARDGIPHLPEVTELLRAEQRLGPTASSIAGSNG
jgi:sulfofructose kinase